MRGRGLASLAALAADCGIELSYVDALGVEREADPDVVLAVLRALGHDVDGLGGAPAARRARARERAGRVLEPVSVVWDGRGGQATLRLPEAERDALLLCSLELDGGGGRTEWQARAGELPVLARERLDRQATVVRQLGLPLALPLGYHRLTVSYRNREHSSLVIVAPTRGARSRPGGERPAYGVFLPLHAVRTQRSWGLGDLTDLEALASWAGTEGATVVSTLPLVAGFAGDPCEPSPYAPVSRRFFHELWIDVERIPELAWSPEARRLVSDPASVAARAARRGASLVDHAAVMAAKREVLEACADALSTAAAGREAAFRTWLLERPVVSDYARFRAAGERFGTNWRAWPATVRDRTIRWADVDPETERYFGYAQWVLEEQVEELARRLRERGQVLALDLPVGVHPDGYDVWACREQFAAGVSLGAPPDPFFTAGQSWGLPPAHPETTRTAGHELLRASLARHLRVAGLLRIDHVMGLRRTFWVPDGASAADGVYVRMPEEELLAVVCLEAARHGADVVGEDLGTVEVELREAMERHGLRRMTVAQFALDPEADPPLVPPPPGSVASFGTHDLPTFAGWWTARDVEERVEIGQLAPDAAEAARAGRARDRAVLARLVDEAAAASDEPPRAVLDALHGALAASDAGVVLVSLEDLLLEREAQNLPGTHLERPNWRRAASRTLEQIAADEDVHESLAVLRASRGRTVAAPAAPSFGRAPETVFGVSLLSDEDVHLFNEGRHFRLYRKLGAHPLEARGVAGTYFAVWAPNAEHVSVIGDFNGWDGSRHPLRPRGESGLWEGFVPGVGTGATYKYRLRPRDGGPPLDKADPFAFAAEEPPRTASVVWDLDRAWGDREWLRERGSRQGVDRPVSIYEVHLGSWRRVPEEGDRWLTYRELAPLLADHAIEHGFTHVELLPVMEHPFYGSWGYQVTGYFAPTARYGRPDDLMALIEHLHLRGVGVILDWVPSHFPADPHGLAAFDGTFLYEHEDPRQRVHPDWQSWIFNYGRNEVRSFLVSNALFWLDRYHADGLRIDAVASMLYLDYSRREGEWVPNRFGGRENLEALEFLRTLNQEVYATFPDTMTIAEESTAWPAVSRPVYAGGLGFGFKWDMGWMHDTLNYFGRDPVHRHYHQEDLTFRGLYAWTENFVLPLSHDEVVHGKGSLLGRMPGDEWQQRANLRALYGLMIGTPGKKLLFMGAELAQPGEWQHEASLDWHLLEDERHAGVSRWVARLNRLYRDEPALHELDSDAAGFAWIDCTDRDHSVFAFERRGRGCEPVVVVASLTPVPRQGYRIGLPLPGRWAVLASSDAAEFGGSGHGLSTAVETEPIPWHGREHSAALTLPPLGVLFLRREA